MPDGDDTRYDPRRRIVRWHREPLDEQREGKIQGRFFNASRNPVTDDEVEQDAAFMYSKYFDGEVGN